MAWATAAASAARRVGREAARIHYRILLINAIVAAVPLVGISFAEMHESQLLAAAEADMIHQAELVRAMVLAAPDRPLTELEPVLVAAASDTRARIRLLDAHGAVRADSHRGGPPEGAEHPVPRLLRGDAPDHTAEPPQPLDAATRREIRVALDGRYGSATRLWTRQDRVYLFSALPIRRAGVVDGVVYVTRSTHDVKLALYRLRTWLIRLLVATLVATALVSLMLATTIARPLARLTRRAQRIAARQPAEPDRLAARTDEIGQLARAVAAMTDELERRAHDARTLAADISHEFKTPLTAIRGAAELLRDGASDDPADRDRFLAMILDDAARLDRLVSRLLELARVEDDRGIELPVDLAALAAECAARPWPVPVDVVAPGHAVMPDRADVLTTVHGAATGGIALLATGHGAAPGGTALLAAGHGAAPGGIALLATEHTVVPGRKTQLASGHGAATGGIAQLAADHGAAPGSIARLATGHAAATGGVSLLATEHTVVPGRKTQLASGHGAATGGIALLATGHTVVPGRRTLLASALANLVANATQFAEPGTSVHIAIARRPAAVRITVANRGPALSSAARARVWDRFYTTRVASGGSGLGLAIVRSVALAHGGAVGVDCAGGVTAFWLELRAPRTVRAALPSPASRAPLR